MNWRCLIGVHDWEGCKCKRCGRTRDSDHDFDSDHWRCRVCGKPDYDVPSMLLGMAFVAAIQQSLSGNEQEKASCSIYDTLWRLGSHLLKSFDEGELQCICSSAAMHCGEEFMSVPGFRAAFPVSKPFETNQQLVGFVVVCTRELETALCDVDGSDDTPPEDWRRSLDKALQRAFGD